MAEFPAMPLWTDAYLGDTTHLNCAQHGAYLLLLITAWRAKSHTLPNNDKLLAKYTRQSLWAWKKMRPLIEPYFKIEGGFWTNDRLLDEIQWMLKRRDHQSKAGKASALKRLHRGSTAVQPTFNRNSTPTPTPTYRKTGNGEERKSESVKAYPGSKEFEAWKEYAIKKNQPLWRELNRRELEGRAFEFESSLPPVEH